MTPLRYLGPAAGHSGPEPRWCRLVALGHARPRELSPPRPRAGSRPPPPRRVRGALANGGRWHRRGRTTPAGAQGPSPYPRPGIRKPAFLLEASARFKREPYSADACLRGDTVVLHFTKFSTRTRISFETAIAHLGGIPLSVGPHDLQLDRGETIEDTARVISAYSRAYVTRTYRDDDVHRFARAATIPVINALTDGHHPCQSIADLLTLVECWPSLTGRRVAYVGDGANVTHSLIEGCALLGIDITVATPPGYEPDPKIVDDARRSAQASGSTVVLTGDPAEAVGGATRSTPTSGPRWESRRQTKRCVARRWRLTRSTSSCCGARSRRPLPALSARAPRRGGHRRGHRRAPVARSSSRPPTACPPSRPSCGPC